MSGTSSAYHYTWPVEKYSYSVSSLASASSDRSDWLHLPQRDNLYLVFKSERKLHQGQLLPTNDAVVKVVHGIQELEELNLTDLAPRTFATESAARVPAIFIIGRAPCLAVKYIASDPNHLRRFQVRFRSTADYEAAKTLFERNNCPVRQRAVGGGTDSGSKANEMCVDSQNPATAFTQMLSPSQMPQSQQRQMIQLPQTPHHPHPTFSTLPQTPVQMPMDRFQPITPQRSSTQLQSNEQAHAGQPFTPPFHQPFPLPNYQRAIRPTPASGYDFPSDERPFTAPSAPQPTPPQTVWRPPPPYLSDPKPTVPDFSDSYLDQELPPPRPPASFFGNTSSQREAVPSSSEKHPAEEPSILDLPPLKKPTPISASKEQPPAPKKTPAPSKRAAPASKKQKPPKPQAPKKAPVPKAPPKQRTTAAAKRPPSVQVEASDTESEVESGRSKIPESNNATPGDDDDDLDVPVAAARSKKIAKGKERSKKDQEEERSAMGDLVASMAKVSPMDNDEQIEQLIIQALQDEEFGRLYETVGRVWEKIGMSEVGRGIFAEKK